MIDRTTKRQVKMVAKVVLAAAFFLAFFLVSSRYGKTAQKEFGHFFGGLGMFLFGMTFMSAAMQRIAGDRLKAIIASLTSTPWRGLLTGAGVTAVIQSSSATTVMVVGFVNAGMMTLLQAIGVILGANIGTTMTAQLMAFKLEDLAWPLLFLGTLMMILGKSKSNRSWGECLVGFALLFLGMAFMGDSLKAYREHELFKQTFVLLSSNRLFGVLAGLLVTLIVQSSSATVGLTMGLMAAGAFGDDPRAAQLAAIPIIFGDNIGTTITALLASIGTSTNARRAAVAHSLFNVFGTLLFLPLLDPFVTLVGYTSTDPVRQVANSHTLFNVINALLFLPFADWLRRAVEWVVPEPPGADSTPVPTLDKRLLATPFVALEQATAQAETLLRAVERKLGRIGDFLELSPIDLDDCYALRASIKTGVSNMHQIATDLQEFLVRLSASNIAERQLRHATALLHQVRDLDIMAGQIHNFVEQIEDHYESGQIIPEEQLQEIRVGLDHCAEVVSRFHQHLHLGKAEAEWIRTRIRDYVLLESEIHRQHFARMQKQSSASLAQVLHLNLLSSIRSMLRNLDYLAIHSERP